MLGVAAAGATCPSCRSAVAPGLTFCPSCGARVAPEGQGEPCPTCGTRAAAGAKFCGSCGSPLDKGRVSEPRSQLGVILQLVDEAGRVVGRHAMQLEETTIGRGNATVSFPDDMFLSPLHAKLTLREGQLSIRDLGSRNHTWYFIEEAHRLTDGDLLLVGSQMFLFKRLGYPGPRPPEHDATRRMGSLLPSADIARLVQVRADGSERDVCHLSPGRHLTIGREKGDWLFPFDPSMSSTHAQVRSEDADFVVVDAGSRNGVAVAARGEVTLRNGSRVLVGDKLIRVEMK